MNRARLPFAVVVCTALVVAGCGGSSSGKPKANATPTPTPVTSAKATSLAAAGVLTAADMPGYAARPQSRDATGENADKKMQQCLGAPTPTYVVRNYGTSFTKGTVEIDSSADVASSASSARTQLAALKSANAGDCFEQVLKAALASAGVTLTSATAAPEQVSIPGSDGAFGYHLTIKANAQGQSLTISGYELGSLVGQVEIALGAISFGATSVTLDQATALLTKVTGRVKAAY